MSFEAGAGRVLVGSGASFTLSGVLNLTGSPTSDVVNVRSGGRFDVAGGSVNGATVNVFAGGLLDASTSGVYTNLGQLSLQGGNAVADIVNLNRMDARGSVSGLDNQAELALTGQLNASGNLFNDGTLSLGGNALAGGGGFVNRGTLRGPGTVIIAAENSGGLIQATSGALLFTQLASNRLGGQMSVAGGATLRVQSALDNFGVVALGGGTFSGGAVTNYGSIEGAGFVQNRIDNAVNGTLRASAGGSLVFTAPGSTSGGLLAVDAGATMRFSAGLAQSAGTLTTDPNTVVTTDLVNIGMGAIVAEAGDRFHVSGSVLGDTRNNLAWNTDEAALQFTAAPGGVHLVELSGIDRGTSRDGLQANFAWGTLMLDAGQQLVLNDASANWAGGAGALYVGAIDLVGAGGDVGAAVAGRIVGNGFNVYYDPALSDNVWLGGQTYALGAGGSLTPLAAVPEPAPAPALMLAVGLAVLVWRRRHAAMAR
jgi:hypothetical protein